MALVARLSVAEPRARSPRRLQLARGWERLLPVWHAAHRRVDGDGDGSHVGLLRDEGDQRGVHRVDRGLVRADGAVLHQRRGHGDVDDRASWRRAQRAHELDHRQVVLSEGAAVQRDVIQRATLVAVPVGGATIAGVLGVVGPQHDNDDVPLRGGAGQVSSVLYGETVSKHEFEMCECHHE